MLPILTAACQRERPAALPVAAPPTASTSAPAAATASTATASAQSQDEFVAEEQLSGRWSEQPGQLASGGGDHAEFFCYGFGNADEPDDFDASCFTSRERCIDGYRQEQRGIREDPASNAGRRLTACASARTTWCAERVGWRPPFVCRPTRVACERSAARIRTTRNAPEVTPCAEYWLR